MQFLSSGRNVRRLLPLAALALLLPVASSQAAPDGAGGRDALPSVGRAASQPAIGAAALSGLGADPASVALSPESQSQNALLDGRFNVAAGTGMTSMTSALRNVGASLWYEYDNHTGPSSNQVALIRPTEPYDPNEFVRRARAAPGGVWMIGNEPNTGGQDDISPAAFADFVVWAVGYIRGADPTAIIIGPNVLNWDKTCVGCVGFTSGHTWSDQFVTSYQTRYGSLPFNAWGMHAYLIDWTRLPMVDVAQDQAEITAARAWLDSKGLTLPLWITEFGVIYGWDGIQWVPQPDGKIKAVPQGRYRSDIIAPALDQMLDWFTKNGRSMRIDRWFLYSLTESIEPWATAPVGVALLQADSLVPSAFGQQYLNWSLRLCNVPSSVAVRVAPSGAGRLQATITARGTSGLQQLQIGAATNALIDFPGGATGATGNFTVTLPSGTQQASFIVRQKTPGTAVTVPVAVTESCGTWSTLVGSGPGGFTGSGDPAAVVTSVPLTLATPTPVVSSAPAAVSQPAAAPRRGLSANALPASAAPAARAAPTATPIPSSAARAPAADAAPQAAACAGTACGPSAPAVSAPARPGAPAVGSLPGPTTRVPLVGPPPLLPPLVVGPPVVPPLAPALVPFPPPGSVAGPPWGAPGPPPLGDAPPGASGELTPDTTSGDTYGPRDPAP
jgi:hypothetical protein